MQVLILFVKSFGAILRKMMTEHQGLKEPEHKMLGKVKACASFLGASFIHEAIK